MRRWTGLLGKRWLGSSHVCRHYPGQLRGRSLCPRSPVTFGSLSERQYRPFSIKISSPDSVHDILRDASRYNIQNEAQLEFESFVSHRDEEIRVRLLDQPQHEFDFALWDLALRYQTLVRGDAGIETIWEPLSRWSKLDRVPAAWISQDQLWSAFIALAARNQSFLQRLLLYTEELWKARALRRPWFYADLLGSVLQTDPAAASAVAHRLDSLRHGTPEELLMLSRHAISSSHPEALARFRRLCDGYPQHEIYREVISALCEADRVSDAVAMHSYLLHRHDGPNTFDEVEPLVRKLYRRNVELNALAKKLEGEGIHFGNATRKLSTGLRKSSTGVTGEDLRQVLPRTLGVHKILMSDGLAARVFATKSFSFQLAIQLVKYLGLETLGPMALREVGLQAESAAAFRERVHALSDAGIDTGGSRYARVIRKLLQAEQDTVLVDTLHHDLHSDTYGNLQLQNELLDRYLDAEDWSQVNRTLAILQNLENVENVESNKAYAQNVLTRHALNSHDWPSLDALLFQLNQQSASLSTPNARLLAQVTTELTPESAGRLTVPGWLFFVIAFCQGHLKSGQSVPAELWHAIFHRLGRTRKWDDVTRLALWLCHFHDPEAARRRLEKADLSVFSPENKISHSFPWTLQEIFNPATQEAIVGIDFVRYVSDQRLVPRSSKAKALWASGVELLCYMRRRFGVPLDDATIAATSQVKIERLLSAARDAPLLRPVRNQEVFQASRLSCVTLINRIYGKPLLEHTSVRLFRRPPRWPANAMAKVFSDMTQRGSLGRHLSRRPRPLITRRAIRTPAIRRTVGGSLRRKSV